MDKIRQKTIWTIGHSTRSMEEFLSLLKSINIELVADIRSYPGSSRYPHFNKKSLEISLPENTIGYIHFKNLGGRRKPAPDSINTAWRNAAFRGYADYMQTNSFEEEIKELEKIALKTNTAYMCSEAVWWRCHRALVSDYLKVKGWKVMHIMALDKEDEHPFTSAARISNGKLSYEIAMH
ncbi:MAG: DUF488 domain-containing protein [Bacteroidetes bacterium]|nr:DUF488 domain-containing protein [Bacteroidota bacterium]HET6246014.1 DUF488 domain-containing protein [Bacteroidia bacterium]